MSNRTGHVAGLAVAAAALALGTTMLAAAPASADSFTFTSPDGSVTITGPTTLVAGAAGTYTATLTNTSDATTVGPIGVVFDMTTLTGMSLQQTSGCAGIGGGRGQVNFICIAPNLAPGASATATFTEVGTTPGARELGLNASAVLDSNGGEIGGGTTIPVTVLPGPTDVQVTGSSNNGGPKVGSTFDYTFQVKDNGPQAAAGVTFDDQLPAGIALAGTASASLGSCTTDVNAGTVHCDIGDLAVGQQSNITIPATAAAAGTFATTATIGMTGTDGQPANNSVTVTVQPRTN